MTHKRKEENKTYTVDQVDKIDTRNLLLEKKKENNIRTILIAPAFNEGEKIVNVVKNTPRDLIDEVLVIDDGSTDNSMEGVKEAGGMVLDGKVRQGIGAAIRRGLNYAMENNFDIAVIIAGNGKDNPMQVQRLLTPIIVNDFDFVQGSRYIPGGEFGKMPLHRKIVTRLYPLLVRILTGAKVTDGTNGYRAYKLDIFRREGIDIDQKWLAECLEYYISVKVYKSKLRTAESPVTKLYPKNVSYDKYTKVRVSKLYHRLLPLFYVSFGIKR